MNESVTSNQKGIERHYGWLLLGKKDDPPQTTSSFMSVATQGAVGWCRSDDVDRLEAEIDRLRAALIEKSCPHWHGSYEKEDDGTVGGCVKGQHCTCGAAEALAGSAVETRSDPDDAPDMSEHMSEFARMISRDARRYRRLQILGCAVMGTPQLDTGTVSRFNNLDVIVDADLKAHPSRGESSQLEPPAAETTTEPLKGGVPVRKITEDLVRDAARYRWLKTRINWSDVEFGIATNRTAPISTGIVRHWTHVDFRPKRPTSEHIDEYIDSQLEPGADHGR